MEQNKRLDRAYFIDYKNRTFGKVHNKHLSPAPIAGASMGVVRVNRLCLVSPMALPFNSKCQNPNYKSNPNDQMPKLSDKAGVEFRFSALTFIWYLSFDVWHWIHKFSKYLPPFRRQIKATSFPDSGIFDGRGFFTFNTLDRSIDIV